jgi:hypothetical protein
MAASVVHPAIIARLGIADGAITGVVIEAETSADRKETILTVSFGVEAPLIILISGAANGLVGKIVIVGGRPCSVHDASDSREQFGVIAILKQPSTTPKSALHSVPRISDREIGVLKLAVAHASYGVLSSVGKKAIKAYLAGGVKAVNDRTALVALVPFAGKDRMYVIRLAAWKIIEHGQNTGDVGDAAKLVSKLPRAQQKKLSDWFASYTPISIVASKKELRSKLSRAPSRAWDVKKIEQAKSNPVSL